MLDQRVWRWLGLLAVLVLAGSGAAGSGSCTIYVQPDASLQEAIDDAPAGAVICLEAGIWEENLLIDKDLTLKGAVAAESVIRGIEPGWPVISVEGPEGTQVAIEGIAVTDAVPGSPRTWRESSMWIVGAVSVAVTDVVLASNWVGIDIGATATLSATDSSIVRNERYGISARGSAQVTLTDVTVDENGWYGVYIADSARATLITAVVRANGGAGVVAEHSAQIEVADSTVAGHAETGIEVWDSADVTVSGSTVADNGERGIAVGHEAHLTVAHSTVSGNGLHGIQLADLAEVTLTDNLIYENQAYGVALFEQPCFDWRWSFGGYVAGQGNSIPGPDEPLGNQLGAYCPDSLGFLTSEAGGELDRR